jgi:hypothetical protein
LKPRLQNVPQVGLNQQTKKDASLLNHLLPMMIGDHICHHHIHLQARVMAEAVMVVRARQA